VQILNSLALDVGQMCRAKPRTVLNDLALSDAHSWQTENHICDALSKPVFAES